jgi:hypothetical protein
MYSQPRSVVTSDNVGQNLIEMTTPHEFMEIAKMKSAGQRLALHVRFLSVLCER